MALTKAKMIGKIITGSYSSSLNIYTGPTIPEKLIIASIKILKTASVFFFEIILKCKNVKYYIADHVKYNG